MAIQGFRVPGLRLETPGALADGLIGQAPSFQARYRNRCPGGFRRATALIMSVFFVLGFGTVFVVLGASATAIGQLFLRYPYEANMLGGTVVIVFGLFMLGLLPL